MKEKRNKECLTSLHSAHTTRIDMMNTVIHSGHFNQSRPEVTRKLLLPFPFPQVFIYESCVVGNKRSAVSFFKGNNPSRIAIVQSNSTGSF